MADTMSAASEPPHLAVLPVSQTDGPRMTDRQARGTVSRFRALAREALRTWRTDAGDEASVRAPGERRAAGHRPPGEAVDHEAPAGADWRLLDAAGLAMGVCDLSALESAAMDLRARGVADVRAYCAAHPEFVDRCGRLVRVVDVNASALELFGAATRRELLDALGRQSAPGSARSVLVEALAALAGGRARLEAEVTLRTCAGARLDALVRARLPGPGEPCERVLVHLTDISERTRAEEALRAEVALGQTLAGVGAALVAELDPDSLVQAITDAATRLTEADFGAFFYNVVDASGEAYQLYTLSGASKADFAGFPKPRATRLFGPTFRGEGIVRLDDVTADPRYGHNAPYQGMPQGHLPVRSYLAVPVVSRSAGVLGGLFFAHHKPGVFTERHEQAVAGIAGWAAVALDNARLHRSIQDANRLKDEFLATLSHELRNPLNAMLGWSQVLRVGPPASDSQRRAIEALERNSQALKALIEDLLDVSRIGSGKLQMAFGPVDLPGVLADVMDSMGPVAAAKGVSLQVSGDAAVSGVTGDATRVRQVLSNLLSNAVKFTPTGGRVEVELRQTASSLEIAVRDTGIGIRREFLPHMFQRFRQDEGASREHGGLGLGLAIVRHLVEAHRGTVRAESPGPNQGSTFTVVLPLSVPDDGEGRR